MDRALDDIVSESHRGGGRGRGGPRGSRRNDRPRNDYPRDGVRKSYRDDDNRNNIDSEWTHDKYDDNTSRRNGRDGGRDGPRDDRRDNRRYAPEPAYDSASAKLKVENLHYDLTEEDLDDLFNRIGPVQKVALSYDRAGRSNGIAYITYEHADDARRAVREFDGANAKGQPIRLAQIPSGPSGGRPRYNDAGSSRSLADRITRPARPSRSRSPIRHSDVTGPAPRDVDRYMPGRRGDSRSPAPRRRDGRRPGERRGGDRGGRVGRDRGGERLAKDGRPKKTQDELDAEMDDYWGAKNGDGAKEGGVDAGAVTEAAPVTAKSADDDIDMDIL